MLDSTARCKPPTHPIKPIKWRTTPCQMSTTAHSIYGIHTHILHVGALPWYGNMDLLNTTEFCAIKLGPTKANIIEKYGPIKCIYI